MAFRSDPNPGGYGGVTAGGGSSDAATLGAILGLNIPSDAQFQAGVGFGGEPKVLMGYEQARQQMRVPRTESNAPGFAMQKVKIPQEVGLSAALNLIYTDPAERKRIADRLVAAGIIPPDWTDQQLAAAWNNAVKTASDIYATGQAMTPFDVVALQGQAPGGGGEGLSPRTVVQKQIQISTPEEARSISRQVLGQMLGRGPSESEIDDYLAQLNAAQRAQPSVTTTHYNAAGDQINSTTSGGVNPEQFAQDWVHKELGGEEADYQVVSQYMPALFDGLRSPV